MVSHVLCLPQKLGVPGRKCGRSCPLGSKQKNKASQALSFELQKANMGQTRGLEPPNTGTTNRCLNHLATPAIPDIHVSTVS
jgi:hypothetical protein